MRTAFRLFVVVIAAAPLLTVAPPGDGRSRRAFAEEAPAASKDGAETSAADAKDSRTRAGLAALYDFASPSGRVVKDRSGVGEPLNLVIADPKAVRRSQGALEVAGKTLIASEKPAAKIIDAVRRSGEISIEAWLRPANTKQEGPARIVTLSKSPVVRNFTLGQDGNRFDARLRTTKTSTNGIPSIASPAASLKAELTHLVYTRARSGRARIYVNGRQAAQGTVPGNASNWDRSLRFALANELTNDRPWLGTFYLVAVYSRDLQPQEVEQNFQAGARAATRQLARSEQTRLFETKVAPLLVQHCFECHDAASKKGRLDLSQKAAAFKGGENGKAIVPGKSADSRLWEFVELDLMPKDRPALSAQEKQLLRQWIDGGAVWTAEVIDPAVYAHEDRAGQVWLRRLTVPEYIETVQTAVGVDVEKEAREILPPDLRADGFSNTAYNLNVDLKHVQAYSRLAEIVVGKMDVQKFAAKFSKTRSLSTDDNIRELVAAMGKWLLRGPLDEREITSFSGIATTVASAGGDFQQAVSYTIQAMLQSPRFIYRIENQRGDGTLWPVGEYELASRMSYILWGGPPDEELMRAADAGQLSDRSRALAQVRRMLQDPRARKKSLQFISDWLNLGRLENLKPDPKKFPKWNDELAADMRDETLAFFEEVAWNRNRPLADLMNAQVTFATPRLAEHYGLTGKPDAHKNPGAFPKSLGSGGQFARYDLSGTPARGGLLTQGSVLTVGGDEASMVTRGLFVLHDLLRGSVKDPPPCVDTTPVPTKAGRTQRGIAEARIANVSCGVCHAKFEPLAFGLEKFDGLGTFHEIDKHGNKLRDDGEILFPGKAKPIPYKSSAELMDLLAGSDRVRETITWKLTQFALGRPLGAADAPIVADIHSSAQKEGGTYADLIIAIVMSDLVRKTRTERE